MAARAPAHPARADQEGSLTIVTIGALAACTGVTAETIRYYERVGVLPRPMRSRERIWRKWMRSWRSSPRCGRSSAWSSASAAAEWTWRSVVYSVRREVRRTESDRTDAAANTYRDDGPSHP